MSVIRATHPAALPAGVQAQARAEAERFFGDGPVVAWRPSSHWSLPTLRWRRTLELAAAGCLAVAAIAAGVGWTRDDAILPELHAVPDRADDVVDAPPAAPAPARAAQAPPPSPLPTLNITRRGAEWRIEAVGVSRLVAAQRLAQASGSALLGDTAQLAGARPLHLDWHGRDAAGAWQAVLGQEVSFAAQCGAVRCRVWIIEASAKGPLPMQDAAPIAPPTTTTATATVEATAAPPRSDSPDPRIAAHHD